ncbi:MAG: YihA family ribosome biogenesis GTP-binding protein [Saprospiraceae bacterium]|nr:YihA family ribosome biogenesis GTP-binding protein [Saprospiraceae bacterium]
MKIKQAEYIASYPNVGSCPLEDKPEFAFIGRSNVGKSSLINMLTNKKGLAKVSVTPGKTQMINFFEINNSWILVDLPGYGYARTSKSNKATFSKMIRSYLTQRASLSLAFVLIDIRHALQKIDEQFISWCGENQVPFCIVFTKADKISKKVISKHIQIINTELLKSWNELPLQFITSSETNAGREEILGYINQIITSVPNPNILSQIHE